MIFIRDSFLKRVQKSPFKQRIVYIHICIIALEGNTANCEYWLLWGGAPRDWREHPQTFSHCLIFIILLVLVLVVMGGRL